MPKYIITIHEDYCANIDYEIEAKDEQEAMDKASELHADSDATPIEDIHFLEWNVGEVQKINN